MANTYVDYTGNGSETDFNFSFPYIKTSHVVVEVNEGQGAGGLNKWVRKTLTTDYSVETSPSTFVRFVTAPAANVRVRVLRDSDASTGIVDFANGSVLTETELDNSYEHNRYLAEEAEEGITGGSLVKNTDGQFDADGLRLENLADPDSDDDAVNKGYADGRFVNVTGDTMTGALSMGNNVITNIANPGSNQDAATKKYVDDTDAARKTYIDNATATLTNDKVSKSGDTMSGNLAMTNNKVTNLGSPTAGADATNKTYVDAQIASSISTGVPGGQIQTANIADGAVETAKIADGAVTFAKMQDINSGNVIGRNIRNPADTGDPEEVPILDEDDMASDSNTSLATQQSIKAYVDGAVSGVGGTDLGVTHNEETVTVTSSTGSNITLNAAVASSGSTAGTAGIMTDGDKEKLDGIDTGATDNAGTVTEVDAGTGLETSPINGITGTGTIGISASGVGTTQLANDAVTSAKISSSDNTFKVASGSVVINDGGANVDFRVEGDANENLIVTDASTDQAAIGGAVNSGTGANKIPFYVHGDPTSGFSIGAGGTIRVDADGAAGVTLNTTNASSPNQLAQIYNDTLGTIHFVRPQKTSNDVTHVFYADGDTESITGSYGTISDRNLKENINYLTDDQKTGQVDDIKNLRFAKYNLKGDDRTQLGVIAQDVEQTSPGLVSKSVRDGVEVRSVKQSIIHQKAVVALQVALQKIEDLEARIQVLESK